MRVTLMAGLRDERTRGSPNTSNKRPSGSARVNLKRPRGVIPLKILGQKLSVQSDAWSCFEPCPEKSLLYSSKGTTSPRLNRTVSRLVCLGLPEPSRELTRFLLLQSHSHRSFRSFTVIDRDYPPHDTILSASPVTHQPSAI